MTFMLIVLWAAYSWAFEMQRGVAGALFGVTLMLVLFVFVVVHELAHSLVARRFGVHVREIELSPIGGVAKMAAPLDKPHQEFAMALAGPMINLAIAAPLGCILLWMLRVRHVVSAGHLLYLFTKPSWQGFVANLFSANIALALFNLIPAFPMDGGRLLRSALAWKVGQRQATRWAAHLGQGLSLMMAVTGLVIGNLIMVLIALVVFVGAQQEALFTEWLLVLDGVLVAQALNPTFPRLSRQQTLESVIAQALHGDGPPSAVTDGVRLVGWLRTADLHSALATYGSSARVGDIMQREWISVSPGDSLVRARQLMATHGLMGLPVTNGEQLLGVITAQQIQQIYQLLAAAQRGQHS